MNLVLAVWWLVFVIGFAQCNRSPSNPQSRILGQYGLSTHDNSGRLVFTGKISLTSLEQNHLKGQCTIAWEKNAPEGLLDENGGCEGLIDGKMVSIDSVPSLDDAGLLLDGQFDDVRITGTWRIDGFATSEPLGKFEAVKKE
jgi:hypothetical protein